MLIAQGRSAAQVEAMPSVQVVALHSYQLYEETRDDIFKWAGSALLARAQGHERRRAAPANELDEAERRHSLRFDPAGNQLGMLRAGPRRPQAGRRPDHRGRPALRGRSRGIAAASLDAITEAPAPLDPATGKPYNYKVNGTTATLTAPAPRAWSDLAVQDQLRIEASKVRLVGSAVRTIQPGPPSGPYLRSGVPT